MTSKLCHTTWALFLFMMMGVLLNGCAQKLMFESGWMDDPTVLDLSINDPTYLVSARSNLDLSKPVIIAVHGYTASTYEWQEFLDYTDSKSTNPAKGVYVSLVLLGGHGKSLEEFRKTQWGEWGQPIIDEYNALVTKGFTNINIAAASAGGTLVLEKLSKNAFSMAPNHIFLIDSLVVPRDKLLYLVPYVYPFIGDSKNEDATDEEKQHWYVINPKEAMLELQRLVTHVKGKLEDGITLPQGTDCHIFQSKKDPVVDPISAYLIYKGLRSSDGKKVNFTAIDSDLHVFTRLSGRKETTSGDFTRKIDAFDKIISLSKQ